MAVLRDLSYEECIEINGGEHCGVCGVGPKTRRLDRDHEHKDDGAFRGLLCIRCNLALPNRITLDWLRAAVVYLERFEQRRGVSKDGDSGEGTEEAQNQAQAARAGRSGP
jgi:Recombination endonuclease VII